MSVNPSRKRDPILRKLEERVKELNTLYRITKVFSEERLDLKDTLERIVDIIPLGWQYPEICCARIYINNIVVTSSRFKEGKWKLAEDIYYEGKSIGKVEVHYLAERPEADEGPFLLEEINLLVEISDRLSEYSQVIISQDELNEYRKKYSLLFGEKDELILLFEFDTKGNAMKMSFTNENMTTLLGYSSNELRNMNIFNVIDNGCHEDIREMIKSVYNDNRFSTTIALVTQNATKISAEMEVYPLKIDGKQKALAIIYVK